jgi:hypothetical protein
MGRITKTPIINNWIKVDIKTIQPLLVFPVCTNVCSNMRHFLYLLSSAARPTDG